jgi:hypothetical protein
VIRSKLFFLTTALAVAIVASSCGGLDPAEVPPRSFLKGTVTFVGGQSSWPDTNVYDVRVVAFENQPTVVDSVLAAILAGKAVISDGLPLRVDRTAYAIQITDPPRTFRYVVVALQNGPQLLSDWLMLSVYTPSGDPADPGTVDLGKGQELVIDFIVDFNNLPPQPFE